MNLAYLDEMDERHEGVFNDEDLLTNDEVADEEERFPTVVICGSEVLPPAASWADDCGIELVQTGGGGSVSSSDDSSVPSNSDASDRFSCDKLTENEENENCCGMII